MDNRELLKQYRAKLILESAVKSVILGLIAGFGVSLIVALVCYLNAYNGVWIAVLSGVAAALAATPLLYFLKYAPSIKNVAARVDGIGLHERVISMVELEGNDSLIAQKQRENAREKLGTVTPKQMRFDILKVPSAILAVVAVVSITMMVLCGSITALAGDPNKENPGETDKPVIIPDPEVPPTQEQKAIDDMIAELRDRIEAAPISDELRDQLNQLVNDLEQNLNPEDTQLEQAAQVQETADLIDQLLQEAGENELNDELQEILDGFMPGPPMPSNEPPTAPPPPGQNIGIGGEGGDAPPLGDDGETLLDVSIINGQTDYRDYILADNEARRNEILEYIANGGAISGEMQQILLQYFDIILPITPAS